MSWYYPHDKPPTYSYTSAFTQDTEYEAANGRSYRLYGEEAADHILEQKNLVSSAMSEDGKTGQAIIELERMINMARAAEQSFLVSHGFNSTNDWNALITGINLILGTKESFERNIQVLKQYTENSENEKYQDVARFFRGYLQTAIYEEIDININESALTILERAVKKAVDKMAKMTDTKFKDGRILTGSTNNIEGEVLQAFASLFQVINVVSGCTFLTKLNEIFQLEDYINNVKASLMRGDTTQLQLSYTGKEGNPGSLSEIIYNAVASGLGAGTADGGRIQWTTTEQSGGYDYKPDRFLATINISYEQAVQSMKNNGKTYGRNVRPKGIDAMHELYKQVGDAKGDIVIISDKNYIINQAFQQRKGFKAQDSTSLNALSGLFNSLDITGFDIDAMINYLANIGSTLVEKQIDNHILEVLSAQIGNFLFDDLSFSNVPVNANIVHIFNLSGIYVPLSIILEGVLNGLNKVQQTQLESFVSVSFKASNDTPDRWTKDKAPWVQFREAKMANNKLTIHFLQDFATIITNAMYS